jgi:PAS domain S-box-containing protein
MAEMVRGGDRTLQLLLDYAPAAIAMFDREMRYLAVSRRFITDYQPAITDLIGRSHYEAFPDLPAVWKAVHQRCLAGESAAATEDLFQRADGAVHWVHWEIHPWYDDAGAIGGIVLFSEDVTDHVRMREAQRESDERYRLMFETMVQGVVFHDASGQITYTNPAALRILGLTLEQLRGRTALDPRWRAMHADGTDFPGETHPAAVALRTGEPVRDVIMGVYNPADDAHRWININAIPRLRPGDQRPFEVFATFEDITERQRVADQLRRSEEQYRYLFENNPHPMWAYDLHSLRFLAVNDAAVDKYGYTRAEFLGMTLADIRPQEDVALLYHQMQEERPAQQYSGEWRHRRKDGAIFFVEVTSHLIDMQGYEAALVVALDVTERRQAEIARRLSKEKYRGLVESLDSAIAAVDAAGTVLYLNDPAAAQLGGTPRELIGKTFYDLFPEPVARQQMEHIRAVIRADKSRTYENQGSVGGVQRWFRTSMQPIHDEHGRVVYALINSTDIHDLKMAQGALEELNRTLEARVRERTAEVEDLYENAPTGYHSLDAAGRFVRINQTELDRLGYTREEVIGRPFTDLLTPTGRELFAEMFPAFRATGQVHDLEYELLRKDGTTLCVLISATATYDEAGAFVMSRSTVYDITARKLAEDALRLANVEMARAVRLKDEFLANMSHELRTPLTGILALGENLQEEIYGPLNERQLKTLRYIESSSRHLLALINDLLDLSKIEAGRFELEPVRVVVEDVCQASLLFVKEMALKKSIKLEYRNDDIEAVLLADPRRLKQILVNLLSNAVKFTPEGGHVALRVTVDRAARQIEFVVEDTGIGIAAADMGRLFQPFTQLDSTLARQYEGTGLGLALVKRLAVQHGGSVEVTSAGVEGQGSCFRIRLPFPE